MVCGFEYCTDRFCHSAHRAIVDSLTYGRFGAYVQMAGRGFKPTAALFGLKCCTRHEPPVAPPQETQKNSTMVGGIAYFDGRIFLLVPPKWDVFHRVALMPPLVAISKLSDATAIARFGLEPGASASFYSAHPKQRPICRNISRIADHLHHPDGMAGPAPQYHA